MPTDQRLRSDDRKSPQKQRKQSEQVDKKSTVDVAKADPTWPLAAQYNQLMPEDRGLCFKPAPRLKRQSQDGENEVEGCQHAALTLGDSFS